MTVEKTMGELEKAATFTRELSANPVEFADLTTLPQSERAADPFHNSFAGIFPDLAPFGGSTAPDGAFVCGNTKKPNLSHERSGSKHGA